MSVAALFMGLGVLVGAAAVALVSYLVNMPGKNSAVPLPRLTASQIHVRDALHHDVETLAGSIGGRSFEKPQALRQAVEYLQTRLTELGYTTEAQTYRAAGQIFTNLIASTRGESDEAIVIGAHYDTAGGLPGANDNASGCAAVLALASEFARAPPARSIRWVFFANEEPPWFQGPHMGGGVYAARCREQ
jgi:acetylornithine deacetylase/succinyl-diaminopimelate desuccinylase-like protein